MPKRTVVVDSTPKKKKEALAEGVASSLKLASIILVGTNDALLEATCKTLAQRMLYFPVLTKNTLQGRRKVDSLTPVIEQEGWELLRQEEAELLKGIADQLKCVTATMANGAATQASTYPAMLSSFIVYIEDATTAEAPLPEDLALRRLLSSRAEICVCLEAPAKKGFVPPAAPPTTAARARALSDLALQGLQAALQLRPELPEAKNAYGVGSCGGAPPSLRPLPADVLAVVEAAAAAEAADAPQQ